MYIGEHKLGCNLPFNFQALDGTGVAIDPSDTPSYELYKGLVAMDPAVSGTMAKIDGQTGFYGADIDLTTANGYQSGYTYTIRVSCTLDGVLTLKTYSFNLIADVPDIQYQNLIAGGSISGVVSANATEMDETFVPLAVEMLDEFGKAAVIKTYPDGAYDPTAGETVVGDMVSYAKNIMPPYPYEQKYIDGDVIQVGDLQTALAGNGLEFTPEPGLTVIVIDTLEWNIVNMMPLYSGEQIALFMLQLRK
ncbi:MAG: hypothetical protein DRP56_02105 [Planctomycetota bacterium]|nr:MAG: hypothetical protein DRP56_02105 [Planctomycetota bacterium]